MIHACSSRDAEIITNAAKLVAQEHERDVLTEGDPSSSDDGPLHERYRAILAEDRLAYQRLAELGRPDSRLAAAALAKAALLHWERNADGTLHVEDICDLVVVLALQGMVDPPNNEPLELGSGAQSYLQGDSGERWPLAPDTGTA
jgi:hypothetical protein